MPYKGEKTRKTTSFYTDEEMMAAIETFNKNGHKLRKAAKLHGVPVSTLKDRIGGKRAAKMVPRTVLSPEDESRLVEWMIESARQGYGRTMNEVTKEVQKMLNDRGQTTIFRNNLPGRAWVTAFLQRHPEYVLDCGASPPPTYPCALPPRPAFSPISSSGDAISQPPSTSSVSLPAVNSTSSLSHATTHAASSPPILASTSNMSLLEAFERILEVTAKAGIDGLMTYRAQYFLETETNDPLEILYRRVYNQLRTHLTTELTTGQDQKDKRHTFNNLPCRQQTHKKRATLHPLKIMSLGAFRQFVKDSDDKKKISEEKEMRRKEREDNKEMKKKAEDMKRKREEREKPKKEEKMMKGKRLKKEKTGGDEKISTNTMTIDTDNESMTLTSSKCVDNTVTL